MSSVAPGWHQDPADPTIQRYWDGEGWLGDPLPFGATPPAGPPDVPGPPGPAAASIVPLPPEVLPPLTLPRPPSSFTPTGPPSANGTPPSAGPRPTAPPNAPPPGAWLPIAPPGYRLAAVPKPEPRIHGYRVADPARRLAARAIDIIAVLLLNTAINGYFVYRWWQQSFWPYYTEVARRLETKESINDIPLPADYQSLQLAIIVIGVALWFAYEVPALASTGQTLGKRLVGIRVQRLDADQPLGFRRSIRRWNVLGLPTFLWTCLIGFALQFFDCLWVLIDRPLHQALHDRAAGTVVIYVGRQERTTATSDRGPASDQEGGAR